VAAVGSTDQPGVENERFPAALRDRGLVLGVTLRVDGVSGAGGGVVLAGGRRTGRHYVRRELNLLRDMAEHTANHLERVELARRIREEQEERSRVDALHRAKSEFLSRVSHDLRTPLTSISWSVQNLMDGVVGELTADQREYLREIGHSSAYLTRLVQNLLRMSRLERGELAAHCDRIDLARVVRDSLTTLGAVARARDVAIVPGLPRQPVLAWADADLLEEALVNILENAVEFSPPGGSVDVMLENDENGARILVRDRGPGLPSGGAAEMFSRFSQGPASPWASRQGFGLGLHIANVHLRLMEGNLQATDHPEGGAVFTCSLRGDAPAPEETG
jgi:two-component system phosphate regulon sensor histidine kinase PhoR